jgi:hypothetical protein
LTLTGLTDRDELSYVMTVVVIVTIAIQVVGEVVILLFIFRVMIAAASSCDMRIVSMLHNTPVPVDVSPLEQWHPEVLESLK